MSHLPYACLIRSAGHEIGVYYFVRLYPFGCFEIIQVYAAMIAHLNISVSCSVLRRLPEAIILPFYTQKPLICQK